MPVWRKLRNILRTLAAGLALAAPGLLSRCAPASPEPPPPTRTAATPTSAAPTADSGRTALTPISRDGDLVLTVPSHLRRNPLDVLVPSHRTLLSGETRMAPAPPLRARHAAARWPLATSHSVVPHRGG